MKKALRFRLPILTLLILVMVLGTSVNTFAAASKIKKVEYEGNGKVDVEFAKDVKYKKVKVTVKDTAGKSYTAKITKKDEDDLEFKINNYKAGKTYKFKISGVKVKGASKYGSISGTVKIPAASNNKISKSKALTLATNHAKTAIKAIKFRDKEAEKDTYNGEASWDVSFEAKVGKKWYDCECEISRSTGKVLHFEYELED